LENTQETARKEFGRQVKKYRIAAGVSQRNFAQSIDKQQSYIPGIEAGDHSIGLDFIIEISAYFGVKHYKLMDPSEPVPTRQELRDNIRLYVVSKDIDPGYLDKNAPNYTSNLDLYMQTDMLKTEKTSAEIAEDYFQMFNERILPSKVSDIITREPRSNKLIINIRKKGKGNTYQLK